MNVTRSATLLYVFSLEQVIRFHLQELSRSLKTTHLGNKYGTTNIMREELYFVSL